MFKHAFWAVIIVILMIHPAVAAQTQTSQPEIWESKYLFTRSVAHINRDKNKIWGVLYLYGLFGKVDTYHFKGTMVDGKIKAAHYHGHKFEGRMVSRDKVVGVLTSRQGMKFNVTSRRRKD